jgi:putative transcriptional regulator
MICHECNSQMKESKEIYHYMESGLDNVYLEDICVFRCKCGEFLPSISGIIDLHTIIGQMIVKKPTALNGKEIIFLRKNIGLNARTFAEYVGIDKSTFSRWENNQQKLAKPNDRFIRLIYAHVKGLSHNDIDHLLKVAVKGSNKNESDERINIPVNTFCSQQRECRA